MVIFCHPDNIETIKLIAQKSAGGAAFSVPIYGNIMCPKYARKWVFPADRFVEYEKKDEAWAIPLGFGHWEETKDPVFYVMHDPGFRGAFS